MQKSGFFVLFFCLSVLCAEEYKFEGNHFFASYLGCNPDALNDSMKMLAVMDEAVEASGATILERIYHVFESAGITAVYLLSESHASIHTYPEHGACFIDLFTCGSHCSPRGFDAILKTYLQPTEVSAEQFIRTEECHPLPYNGK